MLNDYDSLLHRQKQGHNDEFVRLQRDDIGCRHEWVIPSGGGRMDILRHFPHAPRDERAFGRNAAVVGPRDGAFSPANKPSKEPLHGAFGRDCPRDT